MLLSSVSLFQSRNSFKNNTLKERESASLVLISLKTYIQFFTVVSTETLRSCAVTVWQSDLLAGIESHFREIKTHVTTRPVNHFTVSEIQQRDKWLPLAVIHRCRLGLAERLSLPFKAAQRFSNESTNRHKRGGSPTSINITNHALKTFWVTGSLWNKYTSCSETAKEDMK